MNKQAKDNKSNSADGDKEKSVVAKREEEILAGWKDNDIFQKSIDRPAGGEPIGEFVFYDGPPFATGLPILSLIHI